MDQDEGIEPAHHQLAGNRPPKRVRQNSNGHLAVLSPKRTRRDLSPWPSPSGSETSWQHDANAAGDSPVTLPATDDDIEMLDAPSAIIRPIPPVVPVCDPTICFGALGRLQVPGAKRSTGESWECLARLDQSFKTSTSRKGHGAYLRASLSIGPGPAVLHALDATLTLDLVTGRRLAALREIEGLLFQAIIRWVDINSAKKNGTFPISVNILSPESCVDQVGDKLAGMSAYLQHPYALDRGIEYLNPHFFQPQREYITHFVGIPEDSAPAKLLSDEIEGVMDSLSAGDLVGNARYDDIVTDLKQHQRQAVEFILKREDPEHCGHTNRHICCVTGASLGNAITSTGGIIADVMGMGKTLATITAIVATKHDSRRFTNQRSHVSDNQRPGPTLVVMPSVQLMDVWLEEIRTHVKPKAIVVSEFHGPGRAKSAAILLAGGPDIVITTYSTLAEDSKSNKPRVLQKIAWYRVVLDEAHWIRNQSSKRFKAAKALVSERRWCLTGTPVQNSLGDLTSLVNFLDIQPFAQQSKFKSFILAPLRHEADKSRCRNLRTLLSSICLRRRSNCLHLPKAIEELVYIEQTEEEERERKRVEKACLIRMEELVSGADGGRGSSDQKKKCNNYNIMFDIMMQLRRLCNNGTFRPWVGTYSGGSTKPALAVPIEDPDTGPCEQCDGGEMADSDEKYCSLCQRELAASPSSRTGTLSSGTSHGAHMGATAQPDRPTMEMGGISSKLQRIVDNIEGYPAGDKSIVFSSWTSTLDILQHLLKCKEIPFERIDGAVKASDRAGIIQRFSDNPQIPVILLSIGCGAVGLTITAANRVHLVEPQWNPFVEEQAIARAVRMGQEREVTIHRSVVKGSVEKSIMDLQKKKSNLAKFTIDGGEDRMTGNLEDLRFVLDFPA